MIREQPVEYICEHSLATVESVSQAIINVRYFLQNGFAVPHTIDLTVFDLSLFYVSETDKLLDFGNCSTPPKIKNKAYIQD